VCSILTDRLLDSSDIHSHHIGTASHKQRKMKAQKDSGEVSLRCGSQYPTDYNDRRVLSGVGSLAPLLSITVVRTISFSIYTSSQNGFNSAIRKTFGEDVYKNDTRFPRWADIAQWSLSGATAGAAVSVIACTFSCIACYT